MSATRTPPARDGDPAAGGEQTPVAAPPSVAQLARRRRMAVPLLAAMTLMVTWWGWKQGAYFPSVFYPAAFGIYALLILMLLFAPFSARISGPARLALGSLALLAAWTLLSALWSSVPAVAVEDAQRAFLYCAVFVIGIWAAHLLGGRMLLALLPLALAGAAVGVGVVFAIGFGTDTSWFMHDDATLRFPIGYRNANAAFLMICLWPLLVLATETEWRWEVRALLVGAATVLLELAVLAQSRGSLPAVLVALLVYLALSPHRLRAAAIALLAAVPVLPALPELLAVYRHGGIDPGVVPILHDAAQAIAVTTVLSVALAALALRGIYPRLHLGAEGVRRLSRWSAAVAIVIALVGGAIFVGRHGGPVEFVDQRVDEFVSGGYPDLRDQGIRFGANVGSNREDFWGVAFDEGLDQPLTGGGGGSFQLAYLQQRDSPESPEDPHSVEMLMLSELGLPGLALFALFAGAAVLATWRARRLGPGAAALTAAALATGAQWFFHSSYDWFWHYPAITAPAIYLLGAAAAPSLLDLGAGAARRLRLATAGVLAVLAVMVIPAYLADRYTDRAFEEWRQNPDAAFRDLDLAADLNPLDDQALLLEGAIAAQLGDQERAFDSFREASDREPDNYAPHYFLARELLAEDPEQARLELEEAQRLNPLGLELRALQRQLNGETPPE